MKPLLLAGAALALLLGAPGLNAAGIPIQTTVDEFGNGTSDYSLNTTLPSAVTVDITGGLPGTQVLVYRLPYLAVEGDVRLNESDLAVVPSDVIRFFNFNSVSFMVFYSDNADGVDSPADTGLPTNAFTNVVTIKEIGPEGNNGATYTPGKGEPGYISTDFSVTYNFTSDSETPEPATLGMMGFGLVALAGTRKLRRR